MDIYDEILASFPEGDLNSERKRFLALLFTYLRTLPKDDQLKTLEAINKYLQNQSDNPAPDVL